MARRLAQAAVPCRLQTPPVPRSSSCELPKFGDMIVRCPSLQRLSRISTATQSSQLLFALRFDQLVDTMAPISSFRRSACARARRRSGTGTADVRLGRPIDVCGRDDRIALPWEARTSRRSSRQQSPRFVPTLPFVKRQAWGPERHGDRPSKLAENQVDKHRSGSR